MTDVQHFLAPDGARLAFRDRGQGLPLLCLAGLTRSMADFDYLVPHLPPLRLIRMDYRGRGASEWTGAATYTVAQEGKDALALLDHLGVGQAVILGTSRGGLIGMMLGAVARDRVTGLV
jgi:pimeloyl-ACP methyl ester carboxylesterase